MEHGRQRDIAEGIIDGAKQAQHGSDLCRVKIACLLLGECRNTVAHQHFDKALRLPRGRAEQYGYVAVSRGTQPARTVGDLNTRFGIQEF